MYQNLSAMEFISLMEEIFKNSQLLKDILIDILKYFLKNYMFWIYKWCYKMFKWLNKLKQ